MYSKCYNPEEILFSNFPLLDNEFDECEEINEDINLNEIKDDMDQF